MPELLGGHQFAIPDVNTLKTSNYTNAVGGIGWGARGAQYRCLYLNEATSLTIPAGQFVFLETGTAAVHSSNETRASLFQPFMVQTATSTLFWAGVAVSSARGGGLVIVQVGGPATLSFSASSAHVSANTGFFVPADTANMQSTDLVTASNAAVNPFYGAFGRMNPGYSSAQTTAVVYIVPAYLFQC